MDFMGDDSHVIKAQVASRPVIPAPRTPWKHVVAGVHLGQMEPTPIAGEFGAVLTVAADPGIVGDGIRHRHIPLSYQVMDEDALNSAIEWGYFQVMENRKLLVRSERGKERPGLVVAGIILRMGGTVTDANLCVRRADPHALTDFRYRNLLGQLFDQERRR